MSEDFCKLLVQDKMRQTKKKVVKKYVPPDIQAFKFLMDVENKKDRVMNDDITDVLLKMPSGELKNRAQELLSMIETDHE